MWRRFLSGLVSIASLAQHERRGFLVVSAICMGLVVWVYYQHNLRGRNDIPRSQIAVIVQGIGQEPNEQPQSHLANESELFRFNPNDLDSVDWRKLGFSARQVKSILKYRAKGGRFRIKRDVSNLYVIDDAKYKQLEPYIDLPSTITVSKGYDSKRQSEPRDTVITERVESMTKPLDLNRAGMEELEALPYIGPKTAAQIMSFRDLLGGFHDKSQISEVYYLRDKPEQVAKLLPLLIAEPSDVKHIPINECEAAALADHPFINWKQANAIVNYRKHHGPYGTLLDVKKCKLVDEELFRKIAPYLTIE